MVTMIVMLVLIGVALFLLETYVPMDPMIKTVIRVLVILFCTLWLLSAFGIINVPMNLR